MNVTDARKLIKVFRKHKCVGEAFDVKDVWLKRKDMDDLS